MTAVAAVAVLSCSRPAATTPGRDPVKAAADVPATLPTGSSVPHGDHNPHHGGIVMMKGDDLHYEVVLDPSGREYHVYFTDAVREELPAAVASDVALTIKRDSESDENVGMQIDDAGESWVGHGRPVAKPDNTTVHLGFSMRHESYWIDLPFARR
jgi:hypothetical protein